MRNPERIKVWLDWDGERTVCICPRNHKKCRKACTKDVVLRDRYLDWEKTMNRSRFGPACQDAERS